MSFSGPPEAETSECRTFSDRARGVLDIAHWGWVESSASERPEVAWRDETASPLTRAQLRLLQIQGCACAPERENLAIQRRQKSAALPAAVAAKRLAPVDAVMVR